MPKEKPAFAIERTLMEHLERFFNRATCRIIGHNWGLKLSGWLCRRCLVFRAGGIKNKPSRWMNPRY